jgi:3',5'-cyclic AMP phosphodiesterase CpdA
VKQGDTGVVYRFAHVSDPHLSDLSDVRLSQIVSKRVLGYWSWRRRRRAEHRPEMLQRLRADLLRQSPQHILITGDLTHIALPHEFQQARLWLDSIGGAQTVTVVPGNHDQYVSTNWSETLGLWNEYMVSDKAAECGNQAALFPSLRIRGPIAIIGLNTAVPSLPFLATGRLGSTQLQRLGALLGSLRDSNLLRVLILHHPPGPGMEKWRKRLTDARELCEILERDPVDAILHGHCHRAIHSTLTLGAQSIPVFGIPSASAAGIHTDYPSEYNLYEVSAEAHGWQVRVNARRVQGEAENFSSREVARLKLARIKSA